MNKKFAKGFEEGWNSCKNSVVTLLREEAQKRFHNCYYFRDLGLKENKKFNHNLADDYMFAALAIRAVMEEIEANLSCIKEVNRD